MINRLLDRFDRTEYNKVSLPSSIIEKKKKANKNIIYIDIYEPEVRYYIWL